MSGGGTLRARVRAYVRALTRFDSQTAGSGPVSAPIRLTINDGDPASTTGFDRVFVSLGVTLGGMTAVLSDAAVLAAIRKAFEQNFDREGGRTSWPALASSTIVERRRKGYGAGPILQRTGALKRHVLTTPAVTSTTGRGAQLRISPSPSVNGVRKYRILALGGRTPTGGRIPSRPMVVLTPQGSVKVTSAISRALQARAAANGLR